MTRDTRIIWSYYFGSIILTILSGLTFGFTDSHTPPVPVLLGLFLIFVGIGWTAVDLIVLVLKKSGTRQAFTAHLIGLLINGTYIYYLAASGITDHID